VALRVADPETVEIVMLPIYLLIALVVLLVFYLFNPEQF
jgi:hypothetical protein